jgi:5-methylcytosine-specific restriction endonuclease McrA
MENLLGQFYELCRQRRYAGIILHDFYQEALVKTGETGICTLTFDPQELAKKYAYSIKTIEQALILIDEDDLDLLRCKATEYHESEANKEKSVKKFQCTINCKEITRKLFFHTSTSHTQERERIKHHNRRAWELAHPGTLTFKQWMDILEFHSYSCAYCHGNYDVLEHFIPLTFPDAGTTAHNCVPSCNRCNSLKGPYHPERMPEKIKRQFGNNLTSIQRNLDFMRRKYEQ